jgi:hypothetical protein
MLDEHMERKGVMSTVSVIVDSEDFAVGVNVVVSTTFITISVR